MMKQSSKLLYFIAMIAIFSFIRCPLVEAQGARNDPGQTRAGFPAGTSTANPGSWLASFYSEYISPVDGSRCPSLPSCSAYSMQAFKKHGFIMGWLMTVDRLIHEGKEETAVSPVVYSAGKWKIFDPLNNNDFWWFQAEDKERVQDE